MKFLTYLAAFALLFTAQAAEYAAIRNTRVFIADNASAIVKSAAEELTGHLKKSLKAPVTLNGKKIECINFFAGTSPEAVKAGFKNLPDAATLPGKFGIFRHQNNILFYGFDTPNGDIYNLRHSCGTLLAVEYFLQKYLGVEFFLPGDDGVRYTFQNDIKFSADQDLPCPSYEARGFQYAAKNVDKNDMMLFFRRRLGQVPDWSIRNYYYQFLNKWNKRFKDKPEMFALHKGKRINAKYPLHFPCTSNPAVVKQVIDDVNAALKKNPSIDTIRFFCDAPVKGCECDNCTNSPAGKLTVGVNYSETVYAFFCRVANALHKNRPDLYFHIQTKGRHYYQAPRTEKLPPNTVIWVLTGHYIAPEYPEVYKICRDWKNAGARILLHCYPRPPGMQDYPLINPHRIAEHFKKLQGYAAGIVRAEGSRKVPYTFSALNNYVQSAIMFDSALDTDALIDRFCALTAPKCAAELRKFYDAMEKLLENAGFWDDPLLNCYMKFRLENPRKLLDAALAKDPANKFLQQLSRDFRYFEKQSADAVPAEMGKKMIDELYQGFIYRQQPVKLTAAGSTLNFVPFTFMRDFQKTQVTLAKVDGKIKIKFVCRENQMAKLAAQATGQNKLPIWSDDVVEMFFAPGFDALPYLQLAVNPNGFYQAMIRDTKDKLTAVSDFKLQFTKHIEKDFWSVECVIPVEQIKDFVSRDACYMGFFRTRPARGSFRGQQSGVQKPVSGGFKSPSGRFKVEL